MKLSHMGRSMALLAASAALAATRSPDGTVIASATPFRDLSDPKHPGHIPAIVTTEMLAAGADRRPIHVTAKAAHAIGSVNKRPKADRKPRIVQRNPVLDNDEKFRPLHAGAVHMPHVTASQMATAAV